MLNHVIHLLLAVLFTLSLMGCTSREGTYKESRVLMDTYCSITVVSPSEELAREAINAGFNEIKKLEVLLNYFSESSEITAINKMSGKKSVSVSKETLEILNKTIDISIKTRGVFDPTLAPVIKLWNFSDKGSPPIVPGDNDIKKALDLVGYKKIKIKNKLSEVYLMDKGMEIDLGGIAKGYAADKAVDAIKKHGIKAALVAVAGDIRGTGLNQAGRPWKVGIQNPRPQEDSEKPWEDVFATVDLLDQAISTSGDYQRFFIKEGKRFHHILDPQTGFPSRSGLISVSVIAPKGYETDSLATAVFVLGRAKGLSLLDSMNLGGILVDNNRKVFVTDNLKGKLTILNKSYEIIGE